MRRLTRRQALACTAGGLAILAGGAAAAVELVSHGVLPGKSILEQFDGACEVAPPQLEFGTVGPNVNGSFWSHARKREVGYTIGYPAGHGPGSTLPLVLMFHGYGGNHSNALVGMTPAQAVSLHRFRRQLPPMALVTMDGGNGYWTPHPGDDPMAMLVEELIPLCRSHGLGRPPHKIATMGISMGGYGALLVAEKRPDLIAAVASISPAIWTNWWQASSANPSAYASQATFDANNSVTHAWALAGIPVRVASGNDDPFKPGVQAFAAAAPRSVTVELSAGCHDGSFFIPQEPVSMFFLAEHISAA